MDAASVWVEYLRERAVVAQRQASRASWVSLRARANLPGKDDPSAAYVIHRIRIGDDAAHRAGIIAREAYRQWADADRIQSSGGHVALLEEGRLVADGAWGPPGPSAASRTFVSIGGHEP